MDFIIYKVHYDFTFRVAKVYFQCVKNVDTVSYVSIDLVSVYRFIFVAGRLVGGKLITVGEEGILPSLSSVQGGEVVSMLPATPEP